VLYSADGLGDRPSLSWFDGNHILVNRGGEVMLAEFDGQNAISFGKAYANFGGIVTGDGRSVVVVRPDGANASIVQQQIR